MLPKVDHVVFCEDFRLEASGKYTLLGVAAPQLAALVFPASLRVAAWLSVTPRQIGELRAKFRMINSQRNVFGEGSLHAEFPATSKGMIILGPMDLIIKKEESLYLEWSLTGDKWVRVAVLQIEAPSEELLKRLPAFFRPPFQPKDI